MKLEDCDEVFMWYPEWDENTFWGMSTCKKINQNLNRSVGFESHKLQERQVDGSGS